MLSLEKIDSAVRATAEDLLKRDAAGVDVARLMIAHGMNLLLRLQGGRDAALEAVAEMRATIRSGGFIGIEPKLNTNTPTAGRG